MRYTSSRIVVLESLPGKSTQIYTRIARIRFAKINTSEGTVDHVVQDVLGPLKESLIDLLLSTGWSGTPTNRPKMNRLSLGCPPNGVLWDPQHPSSGALPGEVSARGDSATSSKFSTPSDENDTAMTLVWHPKYPKALIDIGIALDVKSNSSANPSRSSSFLRPSQQLH